MSNDKAVMIRPGLMVSLKTVVSGGVSYTRTDLDAKDAGITSTEYDSAGTPAWACSSCSSAWPKSEEETDTCHAKDCPIAPSRRATNGAVKRWETTRIVDDPAELERAAKVRGAARSVISKHCAKTTFGLLCPTSLEAQLDAAVEQARAMVAEYNATATTTRVGVYVLKGRVSSDDVEATRAIAQEVRELVEEMDAGIGKLDADRIRKAADKARELGLMLDGEQGEKVKAAVEAARKAARDIVRRVEKGGEDASVVLADIQRGAILKARAAFLDFEVEPLDIEASAPLAAGRAAALDMGSFESAVP